MATDFAALGISVDTGDLKRAITFLDKLGKEAGKTEKQTNKLSTSSKKLAKESDNLAKKTLNVNSAMTKFAGTLSLLAIVQKTRELVQFADSMTLLDSRIKIATRSTEDYVNASKLLVDISLRTGTELKSNVILFTRINKSIGDMGGTIHETARVTETLVKALVISGATASETTSVVRQMSQALASGVLRGDEFNSIVENGARVQGILADSLNVTKGQLRDMAQTGQLTSIKVINALIEQSKVIDAEFARMPVTVNRALNNITTQFGQYVLMVNSSSGATAGLADGLDLLADNLVPIIESIVALGKVALAVFAGSLVKSLSAYTTTKKAAIELEYAHSLAIKENIAVDVAKSTSNKQVAKSALTRTKTIISDIEANGLNTKTVQNSIKGDLAKIDSSVRLAKSAVSHAFAMGDSTAAYIAQEKAMASLVIVEKESINQRAILSESIAIERNANLLLAESQAILLAEKEALLVADAALIKSNIALSASTITLAGTLKEAGVMATIMNTAIAGLVGLEAGKWLADTYNATDLLAIGLSALIVAIWAANIAAGAFTGTLKVMLGVMALHPFIAFGIGLAAVVAGILKYKEITKDKNDFSFLPKSEAMQKSLELVEKSTVSLNKVKKAIDNIKDSGGKVTKELIEELDKLNGVRGLAIAKAEIYGASEIAVKDAMTGSIKAAKISRDINEKQVKSIKDIITSLEEENIKLSLTERSYKLREFTVAKMSDTQKAFAINIWDSNRALAEEEKTLKRINDLGAKFDAPFDFKSLSKSDLLSRKKEAEDSVKTARLARDVLINIANDASTGLGEKELIEGALKKLETQMNKNLDIIKESDSVLKESTKGVKTHTSELEKHTKAYFDQASAVVRINDLLTATNKVEFDPSGKPVADLKNKIKSTKESISLLEKQRKLTFDIAEEQNALGITSEKSSAAELEAASEALKISKDLADAMARENKQIDEKKGFIKNVTTEIKKQTEASKKLKEETDLALSNTQRAIDDLASFGDLGNIFPTVSEESLRILDEYASKGIPKLKDELEKLEGALQEQKKVWGEWSGLLQGTFSQLLSDGDSFTQNLADMFDSMIDRMLNKALEFASNSIINSLFGNGTFGEGVWGAAIGAAAIGVSYLLSDDNAPRRGDIAPSRTTTSGDDRALGFRGMVAADIAARDHIYALQLEEFRIMNQNLKVHTEVILNAAAPFKGEIQDFFIGMGDSIFDFLPTGAKDALSGISDMLSTSVDVFNPLTEAVSSLGDAATNSISNLIGLSSGIEKTFSSSGGLVTTLDGATLPYTPTGSAEYPSSPIPQGGNDVFDAYSGGGGGGGPGALDAVFSVVTAAYGVYSLVAGWDELTTSNKIISTIGTVISVVTAAATATAAVAAAVGATSVAATANVVLAAIPIVGWVVAALINIYQSITIALEHGIVAGLDQALSFGLGGIHSKMFGRLGGAIATSLVFGPVAGILSYMNSKEPTPPKISLGSATHSAAGGVPEYRQIRHRRDGRSPVLIPGDTKGLVGTSEFGITRINVQHTELTSSLIKSMRKIIKLIQRTDHIIAEGIKAVDATTGEDTLKKFNKKKSGFEVRSELEDSDFATMINARMNWLVRKIGKTRTIAGKAFRAWFNLFKNKIGAEHVLGIAQQIATNLEGLVKLPLNLVKLIGKNVKSLRHGGTPEDAVKEMTAIVTTYTLLNTGLDALGATDVSDVKIVSFLAKMNNIGFAVNEAGASLLQYAQILAINNEDISDGIDDLFSFADDRKFNKRDYSNFFSVIGSFSSLGQSLGVATESMTDFMGIADIVGDIAEATLDKAEFDTLKEQSVKYGGRTVARARKEIEELGLATGDSILQVVNNVMFLNNALEITGNTFASMGKTLLETVVFSQEIIEVMGGLEEAENKWSAFIKAMYSDIEIANINYKQAANSANSLLKSIGLGGLAFDKFREVFDAALPELTPTQVNSWVNTGIAIGAANEALDQLTSGLVTDLQAIWSIGDASNERYERELDYIKQINEYVDSLLVNDQLSPLSNAQRLAEAKSQFSVQLSLAKVGDEDALQGITGFANEYLTEARSFFASGADYTSIFEQVTSSLLGIDAPSAIEFDFNDIPDSILEQTSALLLASEVSMEGIIAAINKAFGADFATTNEGFKSILSGVSATRDAASASSEIDSIVNTVTTPDLGASLNDRQLIDAVFKEGYGRTPKSNEIDYWTRVLEIPSVDRTKAISLFEDFGKNNWGIDADLSGINFFADGGISDKPAIFGEAGAEAAVPLPNGRSIPVELSGSQIDTDAIVNAIDASAEDNAQRLFTIQQELQESRRENAKLNRRLSKLEVMA